MVIRHHNGHSKTCKGRPSYVLQPSQCRATRRRLSALSAISEPATVRNHFMPRRPPDQGAHTPVTHMPGEGKPSGPADPPAVAMPGSSLYHEIGRESLRDSVWQNV